MFIGIQTITAIFQSIATQTDQFIAQKIMNVRYGVWSGRAAPLMSPFGCRCPFKPSAAKGYAWKMLTLLQMLTAINENSSSTTICFHRSPWL